MISLSNLSSTPPKKVIEIKPIELPSNPEDQEQEEENYQSIKDKIAEAQKQYEELNLRILERRQEAEKEILQLKEDWQQEKEQLTQAAQQTGYQQGFEQGKQDSLQQYSKMISHANKIIEQANIDVRKKIEQSDEIILQIAMHAAEKILHQTLEEDAHKFVGIVKAAMNYVKKYPSIAVYTSPNDYAYLLEHQEELKEILQGQSELSIYPDSDLDSYQVYIESPVGRLEASVDTQLEEIRNHLAQVMEEIIREQTENTR